jgi:hypothetical protein
MVRKGLAGVWVARLIPAAGEDAVHVVGVGDASAALEAVEVILALYIAACLRAGDGLDVVLFLDARRGAGGVYAVGCWEGELRADSAGEDEEEESLEKYHGAELGLAAPQ